MCAWDRSWGTAGDRGVSLSREEDRKWFTTSVVPGKKGQSRKGGQVSNERSRVWSPLARNFADLGRVLFAAARVAEVLEHVVGVATTVMAGANGAGITLRGADGVLRTTSATDERCARFDQLQQETAEGPFAAATAVDGTGISGSPDLAKEPLWPQLGPRAAQEGIRGVLCADMALPAPRAGTLNVYTSEPRGLAASDPDTLLVLASFAATALATTGVVTSEELAAEPIRGPLRSGEAMKRAAELLMLRRRLSAEEAYDVLEKAVRELTEWRS